MSFFIERKNGKFDLDLSKWEMKFKISLSKKEVQDLIESLENSLRDEFNEKILSLKHAEKSI